jgi:hypothetical protein
MAAALMHRSSTWSPVGSQCTLVMLKGRFAGVLLLTRLLVRKPGALPPRLVQVPAGPRVTGQLLGRDLGWPDAVVAQRGNRTRRSCSTRGAARRTKRPG